MVSGGVSQIPEVQCQSGQVPHANGANSKQPCLHGLLRHLQARMLEHYQQAQSFRALSQATHQRIARRLCPASAVQGRCVTSVTSCISAAKLPETTVFRRRLGLFRTGAENIRAKNRNYMATSSDKKVRKPKMQLMQLTGTVCDKSRVRKFDPYP